MDRDIQTALETLRLEVRPYWGRFSAPLTIDFPAADTDRDVAHTLGVRPDGYHVVEADHVVYRRPGPWATNQIAYLRSPNAGTRATVIFFTLREAR